MHLTRQTDFALRTLIYLAALPLGERVQIKGICEDFEISANHLSKVVNKLANIGYIDSLRGRGGGIRLGMPASEINIGDIVRMIEPTLNPVNCYEPHCALLPACRFKSILAQASKAFVDTISRYTLEDLVDGGLDVLIRP
jgi:Rrf2 family transcriptional regulator, nitric oxide-sensitive transcriptional repressor